MELEAQHAKAWGCSEMLPRSKPGSINAYIMREAEVKSRCFRGNSGATLEI